MAQAMELLLNECMKIERHKRWASAPISGAKPGTARPTASSPTGQDARRPVAIGRAAGPRREVLSAASGAGTRSEKALRLALAEMYVQGVSTSKVTKITEELCGCEISSSDVSRATALLDEDLRSGETGRLGRSST